MNLKKYTSTIIAVLLFAVTGVVSGSEKEMLKDAQTVAPELLKVLRSGNKKVSSQAEKILKKWRESSDREKFRTISTQVLFNEPTLTQQERAKILGQLTAQSESNMLRDAQTVAPELVRVLRSGNKKVSSQAEEILKKWRESPDRENFRTISMRVLFDNYNLTEQERAKILGQGSTTEKTAPVGAPKRDLSEMERDALQIAPKFLEVLRDKSKKLDADVQRILTKWGKNPEQVFDFDRVIIQAALEQPGLTDDDRQKIIEHMDKMTKREEALREYARKHERPATTTGSTTTSTRSSSSGGASASGTYTVPAATATAPARSTPTSTSAPSAASVDHPAAEAAAVGVGGAGQEFAPFVFALPKQESKAEADARADKLKRWLASGRPLDDRVEEYKKLQEQKLELLSKRTTVSDLSDIDKKINASLKDLRDSYTDEQLVDAFRKHGIIYAYPTRELTPGQASDLHNQARRFWEILHRNIPGSRQEAIKLNEQLERQYGVEKTRQAIHENIVYQ